MAVADTDTSADTKADDTAVSSAEDNSEFEKAFAEFTKPDESDDDDDQGDDGSDAEEAEGEEGEGDAGDGKAEAEAAEQKKDDAADGAAAVEAADQSKQDDIWAKAPPEARAAYEAAQAEIAKLKNNHSTNRGRFSAIGKQMAALMKAADATTKPKIVAEIEKTLESDEYKGFEKDYPDQAKINRKNLEMQRDAANQAAEDMRAVAKSAVELTVQKELSVLEEAHPDWEPLTSEPKFVEWAGKQTGDLREKIDRNWAAMIDGKSAIEVLTAYKAATGRAKAKEPPPAKDAGGKTSTRPVRDSKTQAKLDATKQPDNKGKGETSQPAEGTEFERSFAVFARKKEKGQRQFA